MKESGPRVEKKDFMPVVGNLSLIRGKLTAKPNGYAVAFFLTKDFKIYVSSDNSHVKAAQMAGLPSNNSKYILLKGRILPQIPAFSFQEKEKSPDDFLRGDIDTKLIDTLVPEAVSALKHWLGENFEDYDTLYDRTKQKRSYEGD